MMATIDHKNEIFDAWCKMCPRYPYRLIIIDTETPKSHIENPCRFPIRSMFNLGHIAGMRRREVDCKNFTFYEYTRR
jgi:hypothetical protein